MLKFSVITPSFNQGQFIHKCINGVCAQEGVSVEHIILDNCSTDATYTILQNYNNNHAKVELNIIVEPDNGQTVAINKGFLMATGDIVCWLNTDEWYEDDSLFIVSQFFNTHLDVDIVFGGCDFVDIDGKFIKRKSENFFSESMLLYYGCFIPSCSTFVRRRVIDAGILLNPEFKVNMDYDWYLRMSKLGYKFANIPNNIASFIWHENNISSIFSKRRLQEHDIYYHRCLVARIALSY